MKLKQGSHLLALNKINAPNAF